MVLAGKDVIGVLVFRNAPKNICKSVNYENTTDDKSSFQFSQVLICDRAISLVS